MIDFNEEVKKFKPSLEVEKIKEKDEKDLIDIIEQITSKNNSKE